MSSCSLYSLAWSSCILLYLSTLVRKHVRMIEVHLKILKRKLWCIQYSVSWIIIFCTILMILPSVSCQSGPPCRRRSPCRPWLVVTPLVQRHAHWDWTRGQLRLWLLSEPGAGLPRPRHLSYIALHSLSAPSYSPGLASTETTGEKDVVKIKIVAAPVTRSINWPR